VPLWDSLLDALAWGIIGFIVGVVVERVLSGIHKKKDS